MEVKSGRNKEEFFGMLTHAITFFRLAHWNRAGNAAFSAHIALEETYDSLLSIIDELLEATQGEEDVIFELIIPTTNGQINPFDFTNGLIEYIRKTRKIFEHSWQQNEIDNIEKILNKLKYKLKFLK
jgi:hypothetical protein